MTTADQLPIPTPRTTTDRSLVTTAKTTLGQLWDQAHRTTATTIPPGTPYMHDDGTGRIVVYPDGLPTPTTAALPDHYRLLAQPLALALALTGTCPDCDSPTVIARIGTNPTNGTPIHLCTVGQHRLRLDAVTDAQPWTPQPAPTTTPAQAPAAVSPADEIHAFHTTLRDRGLRFPNRRLLPILRALADNAQPDSREATMSLKELEDASGVSYSSVRKVIREAETELGLWLRVTIGAGRCPTVYRVPTIPELVDALTYCQTHVDCPAIEADTTARLEKETTK